MVLSYCVSEEDPTRLTIMGERCMREAVCEKAGIRSLLLVAEQRHMPRSFWIFQRTITCVELYNRSVYVRYEPEYYAEADGFGKTFKKLRSRYMALRLLTEWGLNIALPLLVKNTKGVV